MSDSAQQAAAASDLKQVTRATRLKELALKNLFLTCACVAVLAVILIFVFTFWKAIPVITDIGLGEFFGLTWAPTGGSLRHPRAARGLGHRHGGLACHWRAACRRLRGLSHRDRRASASPAS